MLHQFMKERNLLNAIFAKKIRLKCRFAPVHEGKKHYNCDLCKFSDMQFIKGRNIIDKMFSKIRNHLKAHFAPIHEGKNLLNVIFARKICWKPHFSPVHEGKNPFKLFMRVKSLGKYGNNL